MSDEKMTDEAMADLFLGGGLRGLQVIRGAMAALADHLTWTETEHEDGSWHVFVSIDAPGFEYAGNDGHLLSHHLDEAQLSAFCMLMESYGEDSDE